MGRRALPKIDPQLDYGRWLVLEDDLPATLPDKTVFGRSAPLEIEIGSGKGMFLAQASRQHPEHDFLGIEIAGKYAQYAAAALARQVSSNGRVVHGDGARIVAERVGSDCVTALHVYFPDPWWKQRHRKRRVMNSGFLRQVQRVLINGGRLHFWTDVHEYFESTLKLIARETDLGKPQILPAPTPDQAAQFRTHFERRMRIHEKPVYRCFYRKS